MKKTTRILSAVLVMIVLTMTVFSVNAHAFGGYAHWEIARRAVSENNIPTSNNYAYAYMSGALLADIGKNSWDNKYTVSDCAEFAKKMMEIDPPNNQGTYFARGWSSHVYQDTHGSVSQILDDGDSYRVNCGQIDEYLRDTLKKTCPINGTDNLYVVYDLIRDTYEALDGFSPKDSEINSEIESMYFLYNMQILLNFSGMSTAQIQRMNDQFDELAKNCYSTTSNLLIDHYYNDSITTMDLIQRERSNYVKADALAKIEEAAKDCAHLETISYSDGVAELRFVIDDPETYFALAKQHAELIIEGTEFDISY